MVEERNGTKQSLTGLAVLTLAIGGMFFVAWRHEQGNRAGSSTRPVAYQPHQSQFAAEFVAGLNGEKPTSVNADALRGSLRTAKLVLVSPEGAPSESAPFLVTDKGASTDIQRANHQAITARLDSLLHTNGRYVDWPKLIEQLLRAGGDPLIAQAGDHRVRLSSPVPGLVQLEIL